MIINWEGKKYRLEFGDLEIEHAEALEDYTGQPLGEWLGALDKGVGTSVKLLRPIFWLMLAQNTPAADLPPIEAVSFKLLRFAEAFQAADLTEAEARAVKAAQAEQNGAGEAPVVDPTSATGNGQAPPSPASPTPKGTTRHATHPAPRTEAGG